MTHKAAFGRGVRTSATVGLAVVIGLGCGGPELGSPAGIEDGIDSSVAQEVLEERTPESLASLLLVNGASLERLRDQVGLSTRVAQAITARRQGEDGVLQTDDDVAISGLADLDSIPYVGPATIAALRQHAAKSEFLAEATRLLSSTTPEVVRLDSPMDLDCANLSADAHAYARANGVCGAEASQPGVSRSELVAVGGCGTSSIFIKKVDLMFGIDAFDIGASSTLGPMVLVSYSVAWKNSNTGRVGGYSGVKAQLSDKFSDHRLISTGRGRVCGFLGGKVTLWWGGACTINFPTGCTP